MVLSKNTLLLIALLSTSALGEPEAHRPIKPYVKVGIRDAEADHHHKHHGHNRHHHHHRPRSIDDALTDILYARDAEAEAQQHHRPGIQPYVKVGIRDAEPNHHQKHHGHHHHHHHRPRSIDEALVDAINARDAEAEAKFPNLLKPIQKIFGREVDEDLFARDADADAEAEAEAKFPNLLKPIQKIFGRSADQDDYVDALLARNAEAEAEAKFPGGLLKPITKILGRDADADAEAEAEAEAKLGIAPNLPGLGHPKPRPSRPQTPHPIAPKPIGRPRPRSFDGDYGDLFARDADADAEAEPILPLLGGLFAKKIMGGKGKRDAEADAEAEAKIGPGSLPLPGLPKGLPRLLQPNSQPKRPRSVDDSWADELFVRDAEAEAEADPEVWEF